MWHQQTLSIQTQGRGTLDIGDEVARVVAGSGISLGLANLFLAHTSASLVLCENADPTVRQDLEDFLARTAPDGDPRYRHDLEGPDDMAAHLRTVLTGSFLTVPITNGHLALGTWQGIYVYEHRSAGHRRSLIVTVQGQDSSRD
jgi:secondary thiamine-phosphate synthase enzyme